ncbi:Actin-related protein 2/3 complex subunit 3 [Hondaea fermentalgiana]|uniref:Actin-related protein 2/3 complex subunit 3 n=1 Tax=Hondaea fermentalgiana TaxID=2315210 RepID=A0A2R5GJU4_9STRA|nr:Actin-related protein 2/3 complex subunit 3 [Hondaea fermentalgiana]|eukprot:GBG30895.1 Actin-related protein 2/3 complex subunit 3 [Hondaea fermentalgiana]
MPAYHSTLNDDGGNVVCGMSVLPLKTSVKGPAPRASGSDEDIIDEAIKFFRANVLFASYVIEGPADRVIIFLTLFISQILKRMEKAGNKQSGAKIMFDLSKEKFPLPGESGWPLGGHIPAPKGRDEEDKCRNYMKQLREECCNRMLDRLYAHSEAAPDKFWMGFSKRKFMNILVR